MANSKRRFIAIKDFRGVWAVWDTQKERWASPDKSRWMTQELADAAAQKINDDNA